jgi:hypothetical protein
MLPVLSYHFSLRPSDVWALTDEEVQVYLDAVEELNRGQ